MSFLDFLLANDPDGHLQAMVDADKADLDAGTIWGVYDGDRLVETCPARYLAELARHDIVDGADRDKSDYTIRPVEGEPPMSTDDYHRRTAAGFPLDPRDPRAECAKYGCGPHHGYGAWVHTTRCDNEHSRQPDGRGDR